MSRRHQRRIGRRWLSLETLEGRRLLVAGVGVVDAPPQNFANPEDTNYDGSVSPADALAVINELNHPNQSGSPSSSAKDVDGDGIVTPRDALLVINRLNSGSDKSSVPPQQRAIGLQKALDAGYVPPNMSLSEAQEMLETLQNGGHYEAGERYRNGQMLNVNDLPEDLGGSIAAVEAESPGSPEQPIGSPSDNLDTETSSPLSVDESDPLELLSSAQETLSDPLYDSTIWQAFIDASSDGDSDFVDSFSAQLSETLASADAHEHMAQAIANAIQNGGSSVEDIVLEIEALRAMLGDAQSQISQLFSNLDVEGILDQLGTDLGTLAEAILLHDETGSTDHESAFADFASREYLDAWPAVLP